MRVGGRRLVTVRKEAYTTYQGCLALTIGINTPAILLGMYWVFVFLKVVLFCFADVCGRYYIARFRRLMNV